MALKVVLKREVVRLDGRLVVVLVHATAPEVAIGRAAASLVRR